MWLRIYAQSLHVFVFIYMYRYTEFARVGVYICVYVHGVYMDVYTRNDSQCVYACAGYGLKCKCEQV